MIFIKNNVVPLVFSVALIMMSLVVGLEMIIFNEPYFQWHYENRGIEATTGMTVEDLMIVTENMLDYLKDDRDSLDMTAVINGNVEEVFGQREKDHMVDVKNLYLAFRKIRSVSTVIIMMTLIAGYFFGSSFLYNLFNRVKYWVGGLMVFFMIVGGLFALNFEKYFTMFHLIFFDNDLWLLDPKTDILINMVPESYFYSIVMIGVGIFIVLIIISLLLAKKGAKLLEQNN